jgi:transcription antitermination factor NusG
LFTCSQLDATQALSGCAVPVDFELANKWFAVYTMPQSEQAVRRMLDIKQIESFLPSYVFVHIDPQRRSSVLGTKGVLRIIGNSQGPLPVSDKEIQFLRSDGRQRKIEPYLDLVVGKKVRIRSGAMEGLEGTLVEKRNNLRFVLTIAMINQHAAVEVQGDELELVAN